MKTLAEVSSELGMHPLQIIHKKILPHDQIWPIMADGLDLTIKQLIAGYKPPELKEETDSNPVNEEKDEDRGWKTMTIDAAILFKLERENRFGHNRIPIIRVKKQLQNHPDIKSFEEGVKRLKRQGLINEEHDGWSIIPGRSTEVKNIIGSHY